MKNVLVISPHLSTGGAPQVTLNKIELLKNEYNIKCVEYRMLAWDYVVQRNRIIDILGSNFVSLGENKFQLIDIIKEFDPDVIFMEEFPEFFMDDNISKMIYDKSRGYLIFETTHDSSFPVNNKRWFPDKFIFVSVYNALRYSGFDIPYEVIEYPVDKKYKDKKMGQNKLGFDSSYIHVVNVGLFTPRKNQSYLFDIARKLSHKKILFHFIGNQAGNFKYYWDPLMKDKPGNCIIWGERNDVDLFLQASDIFFFSSKGDKGNKELNPIAIKEALEYDMPVMMHNLDVYCGKYNDFKNIIFLSGDLDEDCNRLVHICENIEIVRSEEMTDSPVEEVSNEMIIVGTYPNTSFRNKLTIDCINSLKILNRPIMVVSHYPVSEEIQKACDYYVYDMNNPMIHHSYYNKFYNYKQEYDVEININGLNDTNQSFAVLTNMINGIKMAKELGYNKIFYITYDVIVNNLDISVIEQHFNDLNQYSGVLYTLNTPFGLGIETTSMMIDSEIFLNNFKNITSKEIYDRECTIFKSQNFLEDFFYKKFLTVPDVLIKSNDEQTMLVKSGKGVSSHSEYYSLIPVLDEKNTWMFYFYTYNIDNRTIVLRVTEDKEEVLSKAYSTKDREILHEIKYHGKPIEILVSFFDIGNLYKNETIILDDTTIEKHKNNGWFKYKKEQKIKLVHLQTTIDGENEQQSRKSVQQVIPYGIKYVLHTNDPYTSLPPSHNCNRPQCVSLTLFDDQMSSKMGTALTPSHYGCYESFKNAILSEFDNDIDFLIICEGDCIIEVPIEEFITKVKNVCNIVKKEGISYFSFGDTKTLEFGWPQSKVVEEIPEQDLLFITDKIIGIQCIMFPASTREFLKTKLRTHKWDAMDIYLNTIFSEENLKMGILKNRITTQADGYSLIDKQPKIFIK